MAMEDAQHEIFQPATTEIISAEVKDGKKDKLIQKENVETGSVSSISMKTSPPWIIVQFVAGETECISHLRSCMYLRNGRVCLLTLLPDNAVLVEYESVALSMD